MSFPSLPRRLAATSALFAALAGASPSRAQLIQIFVPKPDQTSQPGQAGSSAAAQTSGLLNFVNSMPDLINQDLPFLRPGGSYWFYAKPHFGSPFGGTYFRLDGGGWLKVTNRLDVNLGAENFIGKDANENNRLRWGFYQAYTGLKYEQALSGPTGTAMSFGVNYTSPISKPPLSFTDGFRHTDPFFTYTRPLSTKHRLVGYITYGIDLLSHSNMPPNFGINELHGNTTSVTVGASREWKRFSASLSLSSETTEFMADHGRQRFELNPSIYIPVFTSLFHGVHGVLTVNTYIIQGPDKNQVGASTSFHLTGMSHH